MPLTPVPDSADAPTRQPGADEVVQAAEDIHPGDEVTPLWVSYKRSASHDARDRLILHFAPLVKFVAGRVGAGLPASVDQADLVSYGVLGLIDAIEKFDPSRGIKFETYAIPRIRGAILDELRALDWVPRSVRSKAREVERAIGRLEGNLKRAPTDEELAQEIGIPVKDLQGQLGEIAQVSVVALEELLTVGGEKGEQVSLLDTLEDTRTEGPGDSIEAEETRQELVEAIERLSEREKLVVTLYYFEGLTLAQIGEILGVTESRVSQIHTKAVLFLRARLAGSRA
jgi:RNA polymerase sigma factor for flagellar operon FliA